MYYSRATRLFLRDLRRGDPAPEYGRRITAVVLTIVVHLAALFLLALSRPPGYPPPAGEPDTQNIDVRIITQTKPPPPPPPIELPKRKEPVQKKAAQPVPPTVKRAPVAAMPPIPEVAPTQPEIKLSPAKPTVAETQAQTQPLQKAATSPPVREPLPDVTLSPTPPKVVLEKSNMAVTPPPLAEVQVAPAKVSSPVLEPVPTEKTAPTITLGNPTLAEIKPGKIQGAPTMTAKVEAALPEISPADTTPQVQVTQAPMAEPVIQTPAVTMPTLHAPSATLAPIPQAPAPTPTVALDLPTADVPEPQAPAVRVQAPSVHVDTSAIAAAKTSQPASATSAANAQTSQTSAAPKGTQASQIASSDSWVHPDDQFKPLSGNSGSSTASSGENRGGNPEGTVQLLPQGNSNVMRRNSDKLGYEPTIFDKYWAPANETLLDTFLRQIIEKLTVSHTFNVAPGVRVKCVVSPMMVFFTCGNGDQPRAASSKSNDKRLNMAPARQLVPSQSAPASPSTAAPIRLNNKALCDTARAAGSPPPPGCPGAPVKPYQSDQW